MSIAVKSVCKVRRAVFLASADPDEVGFHPVFHSMGRVRICRKIGDFGSLY